MLAHLKAVQAAVEALGYIVELGMVPGPTVPDQYVVVRGPANGTDSDTPLAPDTTFDVPMWLTAATGTIDGAYIMLTAIKAALDGVTLDVAGRYVFAAWEASEVDPELDLTLTRTSSNQHPAYGVDQYRLYSQPIPTTGGIT